MANLAFVILPSRANVDGTLTIFLRITSRHSTSYIPTNHRIDKAEQFNCGTVRRHPRAIEINRNLRQLLAGYEKRLETMPTYRMSASEIKRALSRNELMGDSLIGFADKYISDLEANGQTAYAGHMKATRRTLVEAFGEDAVFGDITPGTLKAYEEHLFSKGGHVLSGGVKKSERCSPTTVNIRMSHLKALVNAAIKEGAAEYKIHPFMGYRMPKKNVRDICISKSEFIRLRDATFSGASGKRMTVARDLFMLSFYCAGINLTDLLDAQFTGDILTFVRKKTARKRTGPDKEVSITLQPEAKAIIEKYADRHGRLDMRYEYTNYNDFRTFVTKSLGRIGKDFGFEKPLMFYSARKTFVQYGSELGIPLYVLEYAIGQTIKDAGNRPIFNYFKVMRKHADLAIRIILDYVSEPLKEDEDDIPIPEWAKRS